MGLVLPNQSPATLSRRRLFAALGGASLVWGAGFSRANPTRASVDRIYFAITGHNLAEPFHSHWRNAGGADVLGLPLSEERWATGAGGVLQTFENLTLIYDAAQPAPFDVRGQRLDKTIWLSIAPREAFRKVATGNLVEQSGHTVSGAIGQYWSTWGGEAIFGLPLTEPFVDPNTPGSTAVQLFENVVLEDWAGKVRLRPLGRILAEESGLINDPAFVPQPPTAGDAYLVNASDGLRLRRGPSTDDEMIALLANDAEFIADPGWSGEWAPGFSDGLSGYVSASYLTKRPPLPQLDVSQWNPAVWQGAALDATDVYSGPSYGSGAVTTLAYGEPVTVTSWVKGEEVYPGVDLWAQLDSGGYVFGRSVGRSAPILPTPLPADAPSTGRWIDVNLTQQLATAYEGRTQQKTVPITTGMAGWETPTGMFWILNRVANETMTSGAIGADNHYRLEDVLFTQYFSEQGHAIHFAWWRTPETIGRPGSHGCVNVLLEDARYLWDFATLGTPVYTHY